MQMTECESSHITGYGYEAATETMGLQFKGGAIYHYKPVSLELFERFKASESKGKFLYNVIRQECGTGVKQESTEVF